MKIRFHDFFFKMGAILISLFRKKEHFYLTDGQSGENRLEKVNSTVIRSKARFWSP